MGFSKLGFFASALTLVIFIFSILSCNGDIVLSSGVISYEISDVHKSFDNGIQGQFYTDESIKDEKEKYRYIFTGWHFSECCNLTIRTESDMKNEISFGDEGLKFSSLNVSDRTNLHLKGGVYRMDRGKLNITKNNGNTLNAEFDMFFVDKVTGLDTVHISNGQLTIHNLEHHLTSY